MTNISFEIKMVKILWIPIRTFIIYFIEISESTDYKYKSILKGELNSVIHDAFIKH